MKWSVLALLPVFGLALGEKEQYAKCNQAMLNDFEGMTPDEMMECAEILEAPLKKLEEENKAREAAEREAAKKKKAEEEKRAAAMAAAKKKAAEDAAAIAMQKAKERDEQKGKIVVLEAELGTCQEQFSGVMVAAGSLEKCESELHELEKTHVKVDPRIKPLFGNNSLEVVVAPALTIFCVLFCLLGAFIGTSRVTPMINPSAGSSGVTISEVAIRPGNEVCIIKNRTFNDVDLTGCSLRVAEHIYHFDDGYNLAKGTAVEIHAGPDAKDIKKLPIADHDKFDSRRCNKLFWTSASVFLGSGETSAMLLDANDHLICRSK